MAESVKNPAAILETWVQSLGWALQFSGLENFIDRGAWQATIYGVAKSQTQLNDFHFHFFQTSEKTNFLHIFNFIQVIFE